MVHETSRTTALKWCAFAFNLIIGVIGSFILAVSLRILFDHDYSHLLYHGSGSYLAAHVLVVAGVLLIVVCLVGCTGAVRNNTTLLGLCFAFLALFAAIQVTFGVVVYYELAEFHEKVHLGIFWAIQRYYGNDVSNTTVIDLIQRGWKCCGLNSYASWSNSLYSKRQIPKGTWPTSIFIVPKSCCVDPESDLCETTHLNGVRSYDAPVAHVLHLDGCGPRVTNVINFYVAWLFGFGVTLLLLETTSSVFCTLLFRAIRKGHLNVFKTIIPPTESATLLLTNEQSAECQKQGSALLSSHSYVAASRTSLLPSDMPISSLV